jgi:hypothetical protein
MSEKAKTSGKRGRPKLDKTKVNITKQEDVTIQKKPYSGKKRGRKPKKIIESDNVEIIEKEEEEKAKLFKEIMNKIISWEKVSTAKKIENFVPKKKVFSPNYNENINNEGKEEKIKEEKIIQEKNEEIIMEKSDEEQVEKTKKKELKIETNLNNSINNDNVSPNLTPNSLKFKIPKKKTPTTPKEEKIEINDEIIKKALTSPKQKLIDWCKKYTNTIPIFKHKDVSDGLIFIFFNLKG